MTSEELVATLTRAILDKGTKSASGLVLILDEWTLKQIIEGILRKHHESQVLSGVHEHQL
jgi:hypothetical protein